MIKKAEHSSGRIAVRRDSCRTENFEKKESRKLIVSFPCNKKKWPLTKKGKYVEDSKRGLFKGGFSMKAYMFIRHSLLYRDGVHDLKEGHRRCFFSDATPIMVVDRSWSLQAKG